MASPSKAQVEMTEQGKRNQDRKEGAHTFGLGALCPVVLASHWFRGQL